MVVRSSYETPCAAVSGPDDLGREEFRPHHRRHADALALEVWAVRNAGGGVNLTLADIEAEAKEKSFFCRCPLGS